MITHYLKINQHVSVYFTYERINAFSETFWVESRLLVGFLDGARATTSMISVQRSLPFGEFERILNQMTKTCESNE